MPDSVMDKLISLEARIKNLETIPRTRTGKMGPVFSNFLSLPGLRGLWLPGNVDNTGNVFDVSGQGRTLTYTGNPTIKMYNFVVPYYVLDGTGDYFSRADEAGLDVLGSESYMATAYRGLTLGGWFRWSGVSVAAGDTGLVTKYNATGNQRSYALYTNGTDSEARFIISTDGTATKEVDSTVVLAQDIWYFIVGRYDPSTEIMVSVNGSSNTNTVSIPATLFNATAQFDIGAVGTSGINNCDWALAFLCASYVSNELITKLFNMSRSLFNV